MCVAHFLFVQNGEYVRENRFAWIRKNVKQNWCNLIVSLIFIFIPNGENVSKNDFAKNQIKIASETGAP
jgi:hypothetical protein